MPTLPFQLFFSEEANNVLISEQTDRFDHEPWDNYYRIQVEFSCFAVSCTIICPSRPMPLLDMWAMWNSTKQNPCSLKREAQIPRSRSDNWSRLICRIVAVPKT